MPIITAVVAAVIAVLGLVTLDVSDQRVGDVAPPTPSAPAFELPEPTGHTDH